MKNSNPSTMALAFHAPPIVGAVLVVALASSALVGCASTSTSTGSAEAAASATAQALAVPMPAVVGQRLDVAYSDLESVGVVKDDVEILGGGAFGVVTESNWTVCEQRPDPGAAELTAVRLVVDRTCPSLEAEGTSSEPTESKASQETDDAEGAPSGSPPSEDEPTSAAAESETPDSPDSPVYFATSARGNLRDLYKDLSDTRNAVNEGSVLRLIGNSIELSFNLGQLGALTPPAQIADDWNREFRTLERAVDAVTAAISNSASVSQMKKRISAAQNQAKVTLGVVRRLE